MEFIKKMDGLGARTQDISLLIIRLLLALVFLFPALEKWQNMENTIAWFGNEQWGLGLPFPAFNAYMAASIEMLGVVFLTLGLFSRFIVVPLIFVMTVAIKTVHWAHGWYTIAQSNINEEAAKRLGRAKEILQEHGNYEWLTETGSFSILQNGWENPVTYIAMLLIIFSFGSGKLSLDYFLLKKTKSSNSI